MFCFFVLKRVRVGGRTNIRFHDSRTTAKSSGRLAHASRHKLKNKTKQEVVSVKSYCGCARLTDARQSCAADACITTPSVGSQEFTKKKLIKLFLYIFFFSCVFEPGVCRLIGHSHIKYKYLAQYTTVVQPYNAPICFDERRERSCYKWRIPKCCQIPPTHSARLRSGYGIFEHESTPLLQQNEAFKGSQYLNKKKKIR